MTFTVGMSSPHRRICAPIILTFHIRNLPNGLVLQSWTEVIAEISKNLASFPATLEKLSESADLSFLFGAS